VNTSATSEHPTFSLASIVREFGTRTSDAPALSCDGVTQTFGQLNDRSSQVARALMNSGVGVGDRVAVLAKNTPEFFEVMFGCAKIGAILVGLNWRLAPPEISAIVADSDPKLIIVGVSERALLEPAAARSRLIVGFGAEFDTWRNDEPQTDPEFEPNGDDVAMLLYTSGTTGVPKGVMITHAGLGFSRRLASETWAMTPASVNLIAMPLFHVGGVGYGLSTMSLGGHSVLMREVDVNAIIAAIATYRVTNAFFVPAVIQMLLAVPGVESADLSSLELLCYGASPIGEAVLRKAIEIFGCGFTQAYGMTETSGTIVALPPSDHDPDGQRTYLLRSCGKVVPWVDIRVIDPSSLSDVAQGDVGEIWLRSAMVTPGYWNKPSETAAAIVDGEWLRTGDAAYQDEDGYIYLFDRFKDMIVSGAENVYPAEVENALYDHPAIAEVAVIGVPDDRWGEPPKAIVVLRPGHEATAEALIAFTKTRLAKYKCPTSIEFIDVLPRNASGKVLKKDLRTNYWAGHERAIN
jgi:acyl-CoA synthetase (AMP-forming)/AMP-acid ligase II